MHDTVDDPDRGGPQAGAGGFAQHRGIPGPRSSPEPHAPQPHAPQSAPGGGTPPPLILSDDPGIVHDLSRICSAAGIRPTLSRSPGTAQRDWKSASLVLVGDDLSDELLLTCPERRPGVVLVGRDLDDAGIWRRGTQLGAEYVAVLPDAEEWLADRIADTADGGATEAPTIAVIGGRGGAGATTLAAALAVTGSRTGRDTLLLDGDPLGGGVDLVFGAEEVAGLRWPELAGSRGRIHGGALRGALPSIDGLTVLSWDRSDIVLVPVEAMRSVLAAGQRAHDLVVIDLPRRLDAAAEEALARSTLGLVVVPAEVRAAAAAARVAAAAAMVNPNLRLVVRGPAPSGITVHQIADSIGLPLAGSLRAEPGIALALDRGDAPAGGGRGPLWRFCRDLLEEVAPLGRRGTA